MIPCLSQVSSNGPKDIPGIALRPACTLYISGINPNKPGYPTGHIVVSWSDSRCVPRATEIVATKTDDESTRSAVGHNGRIHTIRNVYYLCWWFELYIDIATWRCSKLQNILCECPLTALPRAGSCDATIRTVRFKFHLKLVLNRIAAKQMTMPKASSCTRLLTPSFSSYRFVISRTSGAEYICPLSSRTARRTNVGPAQAVN